MAYRFNGTTDIVEFAIAPFSGYTFGALTWAALVKRNTVGGAQNQNMIAFTDSGNNSQLRWRFTAANAQDISGAGANAFDGSFASTSLYYIVAVTSAGITASAIRFHSHNETSWTHTDTSALGGSVAIAGTDRLKIGTRSISDWFNGDIVCMGIKKGDSTDAAIQTLSRTAFGAWRSFGFDWLVGFDTSLKSGGLLQDQASPGTGDQIAITGTSLVSDPPGWAWAATSTPAADFTGTPLTGTAPLTVTFTDTSVNTPTSWLWDFGDGTTSTSQNPTHSYTNAGVYTVALTATNASGSNTRTRTAYITLTETIAYVAGGGVTIW